jgi:hypothetical protein
VLLTTGPLVDAMNMVAYIAVLPAFFGFTHGGVEGLPGGKDGEKAKYSWGVFM